MCLILFAWKVHRQYPLILIANRDEFYERPTAPADFWDDAPRLLAGRDLQEGGTWLGITRGGKLAALTNYRDPATLKRNAPSRGHLVSDYLRNRQAPENYVRGLKKKAAQYNGFNLLLGSVSELLCFSNRDGLHRVAPGIHGMSNHLLDTPWPKVEQGKQALGKLISGKKNPSPEELLSLLADRSRPPDEQLPATGVGLEWERVLSPLFIESPLYGTRSSTLLIIDGTSHVTFFERLFSGGSDPWMTSRFDFEISKIKER
jgi:uncharacterized protein with NRDE domain